MTSMSLLLLHALEFVLVTAATQRITIDDSSGLGAPSYFPPGVWTHQACLASSCPDKSKVNGGTWTGTVYSHSNGPTYFEMDFEGTGIEVYFILANTVPGASVTDTKTRFDIDGKIDRVFTYKHTASSGFLYNQLVYSRTGLAQGKHKLAGGFPGGKETRSFWIAFDYAVVTSDAHKAAQPMQLDTGTSTETIAIPATATIFTSHTINTTQANDTPSFASPSPTAALGNGLGQSNTAVANSSTSAPEISNASSSSHIGSMIGGTIAGVVVLATFAFLAVLCFRRHRRRKNALTEDIRPYFSGARHPASIDFSPSTASMDKSKPPTPTTSSFMATVPIKVRYSTTPLPYNIFEDTSISMQNEHGSMRAAHVAELARRDARQRELEENVEMMQRQLDTLRAQPGDISALRTSHAAEKATFHAQPHDARSQIDELHYAPPPEYTPNI